MQAEIKTISLGGVNCYLIKTDIGFVMIDSGGRTVFSTDLPSLRAKLDEELESACCRPGNLKLIVLTHGDADHTGNCAYLREKYGAKIAMHAADVYQVENGAMPDTKINSLMIRIIIRLMGFNRNKLTVMMSQFEKFTPDLTVDEGFDLSGYGLDAKVIHLPGHTPGSIGIITSDGSLFCGDILSGGKKPSLNFMAVDFDKLNESEERIKKLDVKTVYPGHGRPFPMQEYLKTRRRKKYIQ